MMDDKTLIRELKRISADRNRCFGCGREHNCGIHGCVIMKEAAARLEQLSPGVQRDKQLAPKVLTRADTIRTMSDEALADKVYALRRYLYDTPFDFTKQWCDGQGCKEDRGYCPEKKRIGCVLRWLQTPVPEGNECNG